MAISAVGLKTHIWNNNIKSFLFLLLYPLVITSTYISILGMGVVFMAAHAKSKGTNISFYDIFTQVAFHYWYVPYGIILAFLTIVYIHSYNRLDIPSGMEVVTCQDRPKLYNFLENLCISRGLRMPYFFIHDQPSCNAYTVGLTPQTYKIVVTRGMLSRLNEEEMEAVLAHELTHLINGDTRLIFLTGIVTNIFTTMSNLIWSDTYVPERIAERLNRDDIDYEDARSPEGILFVVLLGGLLKLADIGALFALLFVSRKREYMADAGAVELTKNPQALISALKKVASNSCGFDKDNILKPALFHYQNAEDLIATHPTISARIAAITYYNRLGSGTMPPWNRKMIRIAKKSPAEIAW